MVKSYERLSRGTLEVNEFLERVAAIKAPRFSEEYIHECALYLAELNNNQELIWKHLSRCQRAEDWLRSFYAPQSFFLGSSEHLGIRANVWLPAKAQVGFAAHQKELYAYDLAHNHDFRFLTVGFHGPGYDTDLYEIDPESTEAPPGQRVVLKNPRKERLTPGKILYFEPFLDVHVQHEPEELSISINLIFKNEDRPKDQLLFDVERSVVLGPPPLAATSRFINAMEIAALFSTPETERTLERIAAEHYSPRVRASALELLEGRRAGAGPKS